MSEQSWRLVEQAPDAIFISRDYRITFLNPAALRLCGASAPDEWLGQSMLDVGTSRQPHPASAKPWISGWRGGSSAPVEARVARPDAPDKDKHVEIAGAPAGRRRRPATFRSSCATSRERRRIEAALRESEERLTLAFAGAQEGIWDWNLETNAVFYSPRWKQMLGYAEHEIEAARQRLGARAAPGRQGAGAAAERGRARAASASYEGEFRLRHKDGHYIHVLGAGVPRPPRAAVRWSASSARTSTSPIGSGPKRRCARAKNG